MSTDPFAAVKTPPSGTVKLAASNRTQITMILTGPPDRAGNVGGWETSERVLRPAADWWKTQTKGTISLPCMLDIDALKRSPSLEDRLHLLYRMGQSVAGQDPPAIRLFGDVPAAHKQTWKLDNISLGDRLFRPDMPTALRRQELTVELSELVQATGVEKVSVKRTRDDAGKRRRRNIRTRRGDTLRAIAVRQLGASSEYRHIQDWNPKFKHTDPDAPLRTGLLVTLR
jgi:hypothetical protein